jgi:hypothetical protein
MALVVNNSLSENKKNGPATSRTDASLNASPDPGAQQRNSISIQQTNSSGEKNGAKK